MHPVGRWISRSTGVAIAVALTAAVAGAQTWTATFTGAAEAPPNASPGTGSATLSLTGNVLTINGTFTGLLAPTSVAHIHCCVAVPQTGTAGVATTTPSFVGFPLGVTSGTFLLTLDLTQASSYNAAFITANGNIDGARAALLAGMNGGRAYFNIHSTQFPAGEIRGFIISTVPEPSSVFLTTAGLFGVALLVMRRRRVDL
jgi:CHRD domain/PEP-CTERM motif